MVFILNLTVANEYGQTEPIGENPLEHFYLTIQTLQF